MIAAPLVIVYGGVFALWTATTYNKADARLKPVMAISWVLLILTLAVLIYFGGNIVNDSVNGILPSLFNNSVQGDVRYETLVTTVGLYTMGMVMYRLLHQTSNSSGNQSELFSFLSKAKEMSPLWNEGWFRKGLISFIGVGILLAAAFWGEGLAPPGGGMPHAGVRIGFLLAWSFGSYWLFVRLGGTPPPKKPARRTKAA